MLERGFVTVVGEDRSLKFAEALCFDFSEVCGQLFFLSTLHTCMLLGGPTGGN